MKNRILSLLFVASTTVFAQENYSTAWSQHRDVQMNTTATGANVPGNVLNFPVLVRFGAADSVLFTQAKAGGADLRFTKTNNTTRLPHQIETWNATTRSAAVWVLVDTVKGNAAQSFRLHWGNAAAADSSNGPQVFKPSNGFQAVWHMNGTANETDASGNGNLATVNGAPASVNGYIGTARQFTGSEYFQVIGSASGTLNFGFNSNFTLSAWINPVELATHGVIISKHDLDYALKLDANNNLEFFQFVDGGGWNAVNFFSGQNEWVHAVGVQKGDSSLLYINGALVDNEATLTGSTNVRREDVDVVLGAEPTSNTAVRRFFIGILDEVRMRNVSESPDWIKLAYENTKPGGTLVSVRSGARAQAANGFSVEAAGKGLVFRIPDMNAAKVRVSVMDMQGRNVWSRTVLVGAGMNAIAWNGIASNGKGAGAGLYMVSMSLLDAQGKTTQLLTRKVPITR
jgi:hypothetical protein